MLWTGCHDQVGSDSLHALDLETEISDHDSISLDLVGMRSRGELGELSTLSVVDPVYKKNMKYEGYRLAEVLQRNVASRHLSSRGMELVFRCRDGYSPSMSLAESLSADGLLAVRDVQHQGEGAWAGFEQNGLMVDPGPFYLVWENSSVSAERPWPYQLLRIDIRPTASLYETVRPEGGVLESKGFEIFKRHCMRCHSVNLVGGSVGVEMNVPINITEYWHEDYLERYIRQPASIRARARMPSFSGLEGGDVAAVIHYLRWMRLRKVCDDAESCGSLDVE